MLDKILELETIKKDNKIYYFKINVYLVPKTLRYEYYTIQIFCSH